MTLFTRDSLERMGVTTRSVPSERRPRVKLHRNAKTTPHMRALLVDRVRTRQWPCRVGSGGRRCGDSHGVQMVGAPSPWWGRGPRGSLLSAPSSAPPYAGRSHQRDRGRSPGAPHRLGDRGPPASAAVHGRGDPRAGRSQPTDRRRAAARPVTRYERARPGELVHLDIKPLGRILRVGPSLCPAPAARGVGAGWEYVHVAVDDHSRAAYVEVLPDQTGAHRGGLSPPHHPVVCAPRRGRAAGPHRQRQWVRQSPFHAGGPTRRRASHADPPVSPADQWQSGTLHPDT